MARLREPHLYLALFRIMPGLVFPTVTYSNIEHGYYTAAGLERFFGEVFPQADNPLCWYARFIEIVIL